MAELTGRSLGEFVVGEKIGAGGFGTVYRAEQVGLGREAVIKVLTGDQHDDVGIQRFLREARLASRLDHPYAAHIYAFGAEPDGVLWIAMELVRGTPLSKLLRTQRLSLERFTPLLDRICEVVHSAHEQGIVHRDLKPDNIMVLPRAGRLLPKLLDLGVAKIIGAAEASAPSAAADASPELTQRGDWIGSPYYMAPEQWSDSADVDARTDVYALGVLCHEALTGRLPFRGADAQALARAHLHAPVPPLGPPFSAALDAVLARAMAKRPEERFASALDLAAAFRAAAGLADEPEALPQLDEPTCRELAYAPEPIAEAAAALFAARNLHEARDAVRGLVRAVVHYLGIVALACRTRTGPGRDVDAPPVAEALRALGSRELADEQWLELTAALCAPFARLRDAHPIPELVALFHGPDGAPLRDTPLGRLVTPLGDSGVVRPDAIRLQLAETMPRLAEALRALAFLGDHQLVVPRGGQAEVWMGPRRPRRQAMTVQGDPPPGRPLLVDYDGRPVVALWPLAQAAPPAPGAADELFLLEGTDRHGARLRAYPLAFERHDDEVWNWLRAQIPEVAEPGAVGLPVEQAPYRGLSAFTRDDAALFFGRERQSEELLNRLLVQRFVAVVGPSGAGKSSFVQAGVIPLLPDGWRSAVVRPGPTPLAALAAVAQVDLLVVDQLEELFTLCQDAGERERFAEQLMGLTREARVVVTLRDDFLVRAGELHALRDRLAAGLSLLTTPAPAQLLRILVEPARRAGYAFDDPQLPARMVEETAGQPGALALLSFTAARLWELRDRHFKRLTRRAHDAMGGVGGALARHAEATLAELPAEDQGRVREAFRHLVTAEGTRAVLSRAELYQLLGGARAAGVVERLIAARLLVAGEAEDGSERIEIVHEALLTAWPRLVAWRREDAEGARLRDQLRAAARQWLERGRPTGLLWRGDALAEYRVWRARTPGTLTDAEQAFAQASLRSATRSRRSRLALAAAAFVILGAGLIITLTQSRIAHRRLVESYEEQGRQAWLAGDTTRAVLYLNEAMQEGADDPALRYMLARATRRVEALRAVLPHDDAVEAGAVSPDERRIVTASLDGTARVWDEATGAQLATLPGHAGPVTSAAFSPDGRLIATACLDGSVRLFEAATAQLVRTLEGHKEKHYAATFSPDGARLLAPAAGDAAKVWEVASGRALATFTAGAPIDLAIFSPDGSRVATGDRKGGLRLFDAAGGAPLLDLQAHAGSLTALSFSRDGKLILSAGDHTAKLWLVADGQLVATSQNEGAVTDAELSPDGSRVVVASEDTTARVWDAASGKPILLLLGHTHALAVARFSPDGRAIVTGSRDGSARLWDARSGKALAVFSGRDMVRAVAFYAGGRRLLTISGDRAARLWDLRQNNLRLSIDSDSSGPTWFAAFSRDGTKLVTVGKDATIRTWDTASGAPISALHRTGEVGTAQPDVDGRRLVVAGTDLEVLEGDAVKLRLEGETRYAELSPDGKRIVRARPTGEVTIVDAGSGQTQLTLHHPDVLMASFSHDGRRLVTAGDDGWARIWRAADGGLERELRANVSGIATAVFSSDDRRIVTAHGDNVARLWDAATGALVLTLDGHTAYLYSADMSPDGHLVVTTSYDRSARIWDASSGKVLDILAAHPGRVLYATFSSDSGLVATVGYEGATKLWEMGLDDRSPEAVARFVRCKIPYRLTEGRLLPRAPSCE